MYLYDKNDDSFKMDENYNENDLHLQKYNENATITRPLPNFIEIRDKEKNRTSFFNLVPIDRDGNCLFESVSYLLTKKGIAEDTGADVRERIFYFYSLRRDILEYISNKTREPFDQLVKERRQMKNLCVFGTLTDLFAVATIYEVIVQVVVVRKNNDKEISESLFFILPYGKSKREIQELEFDRTITLNFDENNYHYDALELEYQI